MTVVRIEKTDKARASGGAMDRVVARRGPSREVKIAIGAALILIAALAFYLLAPSANSQTVAAERLTISTVSRGRFDDFLPLRARATPLVTVYLDAIEGGRVEQVLVEDGATVQAGQPLAILSNTELQLNVLSREAQVTEQLNIMRSQELALERARLENRRSLVQADYDVSRVQRQLNREAPLAERGYVAQKTYRDTQAEAQYQRSRRAVLQDSERTERELQSNQLAQLRQSSAALQRSLALARASLDALNLRAPVSGQLTAFSIQIGQSLNRGERLGQIDSAGRNKLVAQVDEFYLGRVQEGQIASAEQGGRSYRLRVTKIYPQVRNGAFEVDLQFAGQEPAELQRGQTVQIRLTLGDPAPALLIPAGAFYNETGGNWVFVVAPDGRSAVKRQVRLGRRNAEFIEVLDGLDPGERVITSPYTGFGDRDRLDLET
jgi:HlyD family secretion protein